MQYDSPTHPFYFGHDAGITKYHSMVGGIIVSSQWQKETQ